MSSFREGEMSRSGPLADREVMRLVAELYYERDLRQPEVAALTGFSVSKVSRLLQAAREQGIVNISVEPPGDARLPAADRLAEAFGIEVAITPGRERDAAASTRLCGLAAADHVAARLPSSGSIGFAAGHTIATLVTALPRLSHPRLTIVPVVGGWNATDQQYVDGNQIALRIAERLGAHARTLHAPAVLASPDMRAALLRDATIMATTSYWEHLAMAILGVGGTPQSHPGYRTVLDLLGDEVRGDLGRLGVVGDMAGHFFRADGSFVDGWSERTLAITVEQLQAVDLVIAVAAGLEKAAAILGALRTGLVDVLVTDGPTAEAVVRRMGQSR
jgi:DNA-binding transcriptional regulator LsrR (DeoR family)